MGDASSLFGGSTLANLFGLGAAAAPSGDAAAADAAAVPSNYDPATGLPYPTSTYDPTGTLGAQAAVTGSYAPPAAPVTGDGTQTSNTAAKSDSSQPAAPSGPASVTPQSLAAMMQGQPLPTQPASNPWVPGGGPAPSPYFSEAQRQAGLQALATQGIPTTGGAGPAFAGGRFGDWSSTLMGPEGGGGGVPASEPAPPQTPPGQMADADKTTGTPSNAAEVPPEQPDKTDKTPTPPPPRAVTAPPQPPAAPGGMPGGVGNIMQDIAGLMSGNPMALGKLVQDLMRMGGPPGSRQMPGWNQPFMRPNQASPYTQSGDPSTFGGPQYAGATPPEEPDEQPDDEPNIKGPPPSEGRAYPPGYTPNKADVPPPGSTMTTDPRNLPVGQWAPARFQSNPPGHPQTYPVKRQPDDAGAWLGRPSPGPPPARFNTAPGQTVSSAPATAGPQASTPLTRNEASVPDWAPVARGGPPSMRPTQSSVDRSSFQSEANPETIAQAAWMVNGEVSLNAPVRAQIVQLETAFNRAQARGTTLKHALMPSVRRGDPGYYDGRSAHPTYGMSRRPTPQQIAAFKANVWDPVMKGSNLSDVGWGPMTGNASGLTARGQFADGAQGYKLAGGDTYFREGPFRHPFPQIRQQMASQ